MESILPLKDCLGLIHNVRVEKVIGRGAYGTIGEAKWEGSVVAIKEIQRSERRTVSSTENEVSH